MADISSLKLPNNSSYDIKDAVSRSRLDVRTGTGTAGQAGSASAAYIPSLWTFNLGINPSAGDIITIKVPVAGVNAGVWLSVNNGTTYYPIACMNTTRLTTQYAINNHVTLIFQENMKTSLYGNSTAGAAAGASTTSVTMNRWCVLNYYDANTTYSAMSSTEMNTGTATTSRVMTAANLKDGLQTVLAASNGDIKLYGTHLTGQVPAVTTSDNGKFLTVVNGVWAATTMSVWQGGSY